LDRYQSVRGYLPVPTTAAKLKMVAKYLVGNRSFLIMFGKPPEYYLWETPQNFMESKSLLLCSQCPSPPPLVAILSQLNPVHTISFYFGEINFSVIFPSKPRSSKMLLSCSSTKSRIKVKVNSTIELATKAHRRSRNIPLLFLLPRR